MLIHVKSENTIKQVLWLYHELLESVAAKMSSVKKFFCYLIQRNRLLSYLFTNMAVKLPLQPNRQININDSHVRLNSSIVKSMYRKRTREK